MALAQQLCVPLRNRRSRLNPQTRFQNHRGSRGWSSALNSPGKTEAEGAEADFLRPFFSGSPSTTPRRHERDYTICSRGEVTSTADIFRRVFECVVEACIAAGLVGGEGFAVDASLIAADANKQRSIAGQDWRRGS
ncbi:hypothetical protein ACVWYH_000016 [Bradyrhizobium sp. GM24.11]